VQYFAQNQPPIASTTAAPTSGAAPLAVAFDGSASYDPDPGDTIVYAWDLDGDGQYDDSGAARPSYTYTQPGSYTARLRVTDGQGVSATSEPIAISAGNTPPVPVIDLPTNTPWKVGDVIAFAGHADDAQQGRLPSSALSWELVQQHCPSNCHSHPVQTFAGVASGSFSAPDHEYPSYLELRLTATDAAGLTASTSIRLDPQTTVLTFQSNPPGLQLAVGSTSESTPFSRTVILGSNNSISAVTPQTLSGATYMFQSWSDGGAQSHNIIADGPATLTAAYASAPAAPNLLANPGFELDANNDGRPDVWSSNSRATRSAAVVRSGAFAMRHYATDNSGYTISQMVNNLSAGTYNFSGYVNIPATSDAFTFRFEIQWRNSSGSTIRTDAIKSYTKATSGWDLAAASLSAPAGTTRAQVRMKVSSLKATIYVDDLALQAGAPPADTTPPQIAARSPASGAIGVSAGANVTATFDEAVAGVSTTTMQLTPSGSATPVAAAVSYDSATRTATLNPNADLSPGTTYTVRLTGGIADAAGNPLGATSWTFTTMSSAPPGGTYTFGAVADSYVSQSSSTSAYGSSSSFSAVGGSSVKQAFVRFTVSGLPAGVAVQGAKLWLYVPNDSTSGGIFNAMSDTSWAENITWNTRPAIDGPQLATLGAVPSSQFVEVDLGAAIGGNGTYSFAITLPSANTNTVGYASRESSTAANRPQLIVTT
jgi:PKD repeat protein